MASLFKRKGSPYWWIRCKDANGNWSSVSTKLKHDDIHQTREARSRCAATTAGELADTGHKDEEVWDRWVETFLGTHCHSDNLLVHYRASWRWIRTFLAERQVKLPRQLKVNDVYAFVEWRVKAAGVKKSTALTDVKVLRVLMNYAVRNEWAQGNPCVKLGIRREPPKQKPELTDDDIRQIYDGLVIHKRPAWMSDCFTIALHTGCRISETAIPMKCVDLERKTITFPSPKGGITRAFTVPMPTALVPFFEKARAAGKTVAVDLPPAYGQHFTKFLHKKIKRRDLTFHSTRVTRVTRLLRAGVSERTAMGLVNHSSAEVSRIYQRLSVGDFQAEVDKVVYPSPTPSNGENPEE